ncbi:uncharacterized protein LOC132286281 isoform X2 [Cornus florida]|uniref:uncharacterized protein LOC132286281 isoform X2 n=1 Tax=Cornus florida TaxID=4283 RepID=UPI0028977275|nr:uncharacterized protein LOC132286281 isoform X2 [Cornus florida]
MGDPKLLVVSIDGTVPRFSFARKGGLVTWETIIKDIINTNYCLAFEVRDGDGIYHDAKEGNKVAVLKFQSSRKNAFIYGWGTKNYDVKYSVCFDESELNEASTSTAAEETIESSTCHLLCLPDEIKRKIVESLDGKDLAKLGCVCSKFRNLTSDECLWKDKFLVEFSEKVREHAEGGSLWKQKFVKAWRWKKFLSMNIEVPAGAACYPLNSKSYIDFVLTNL